MVHSFIHFHSLHLSHSPSSSLTVPQDHTLLSLVMSHTLSLRSLLNSMQVCSMWHRIIKSNTCNAAWKNALLFTLSGVSSLLFLSLTIFINIFLYYFDLMFCILECYSIEKYEALPNGSLVQDHAIDWAVQTKEVFLFSFLFPLFSFLFFLYLFCFLLLLYIIILSILLQILHKTFTACQELDLVRYVHFVLSHQPLLLFATFFFSSLFFFYSFFFSSFIHLY